jgi:hypothetical protein
LRGERGRKEKNIKENFFLALESSFTGSGKQEFVYHSFLFPSSLSSLLPVLFTIVERRERKKRKEQGKEYENLFINFG